MAEAADIAERRVFRLLTPELNAGLPAMLVPTSGLDSGLMMVQYTAAALVSDNKTLAHPDSVDSIPSCANQEDHVSMGANAARHALEILDNVRHVLAIELLAAAQAIDLRPDGPARLGQGTARAYAEIRKHAAYPGARPADGPRHRGAGGLYPERRAAGGRGCAPSGMTRRSGPSRCLVLRGVGPALTYETIELRNEN